MCVCVWSMLTADMISVMWLSVLHKEAKRGACKTCQSARKHDSKRTCKAEAELPDAKENGSSCFLIPSAVVFK